MLVTECNIGSGRAAANCTSEEANARVVGHARNEVSEGFSPIFAREIDTDVSVLLISFATNLSNNTYSTIYADMCSMDNEVSYYDSYAEVLPS